MENKKEITIIQPEGYEIDKEKSTFDKIVFKKKEETKTPWRYDNNIKISGWCIAVNSNIYDIPSINYDETTYSTFATEKQAKSALAMARISQIMSNDKRFGGYITDKEWENGDKVKYSITRCQNSIVHPVHMYCNYHFLAFHTKEQCELFLDENIDLVKDYLMID